MSCRICKHEDTGGSDLCDQCFDEGWMTKVQFIPDFIMTHENCGGRMIEAPKGSETLACMKCGKVNYSRGTSNE